MARSTQSAKNTDDIWSLLVELDGSDPVVWRRFTVPGEMSLEGLHLVLQMVMGWEDDHLHQFLIGRELYGPEELANPGSDWGPAVHREDDHTLRGAVGRKKTFRYIYDFGDQWEHTITVEKRGLSSAGFPQEVVCIEGANACPPEDVGGLPGYYSMLEQLADKQDPERDDLLAWLGSEFDPAHFDLQAVNERLYSFEPLNAREVYQVLKDTALGQRVMQVSEFQLEDDNDDLLAVDIDDWWLAFAFDEQGQGLCLMARAPDGRVGAVDDWSRAGTDPLAFLSVWELQQIRQLLEKL